jgi:hypothetical protein
MWRNRRWKHQAIAVLSVFGIVTPKYRPISANGSLAMSVDLSEGNENMDYPQHTQTYDLFIGLVKWGSFAVIAVLLGMWLFLL